ncbi:MAG: response regulator transcription factor [Gudongella sp.]|nr:response regulator transcription factor [Gudongella sp.]
MLKICCVEDDDSIRQLIVYALENSGFKAEGFENGDEFLSKADSIIPDLILLDIMMPGTDGLKILEQLKSNTILKDIPVIMITAKTTEFDRVKGLDMGADDYISKPFGVMELISRVKAVLRRTNTPSSLNSFSLNGISIDYEKRIVTVDGKIVKLAYKEFELLYFLLKNQDIVLTRETLMNQLWGFDFEGETRTVDVHIATLRQKIGEKGNLIQTIRNVGYKVGNIS